MANIPSESKIPVLGKSQPKTLSRLANLSSRVRAHLSPDSSKLRPSSSIIGFLTSGSSKTKAPKKSSGLQRPCEFYQPLVSNYNPSAKYQSRSLQLGSNVSLKDGKTGILRYYGKTQLGKGFWCGIELDRPEGSNDGTANGVRYFTCDQQHGIIVPETDVNESSAKVLLQNDLSPRETQKRSSKIHSPSSQTSTPGSFSYELNSNSLNSSSSLMPKFQNYDLSCQSKHSSFELDDSLGILTPDQMSDFNLSAQFEDQLSNCTPPVDDLPFFQLQDVSIGSFNDAFIYSSQPDDSSTICEPIEFSNDLVVDASEEAELTESALSKKTSEISSSLKISNKKDIPELSRLDRTPSLEDLPLDEKLECAKSRAAPSNSFITSITSITSLDNGYQGDGEWSRPASRGPDQSPSAQSKRPKCRLDPMTDSDFFTESDADMQEEFAGHRRAQVIDGTLYGGLPPQSGAVSINGNNVQRFTPTTEEMDSSGIFSDFDKKCDDQIWEKVGFVEEKIASPEGSIMTVSSKSDQSLKKLSPTRMTNKWETIKNELQEIEVSLEEGESGSKKARCESPVKKADPVVKKFKTPKRNITPKAKSVTDSQKPKKEGNADNLENMMPRSLKKGRWDAVMSKIAQGQAEDKTNPKIKEVKSKVFSGINSPPKQTSPRPGSIPTTRKSSSARCLSSTQSLSTRSLRDMGSLRSKSRRRALRNSETSLQTTPRSQISSRNSSVTDLSHTKPLLNSRSNKKEETRCNSPQSDVSVNSTASQPKKGPLVKSPTTGKSVSSTEKQNVARKTTLRRLVLSTKPQPLRDLNRGNNSTSKPHESCFVSKETSAVSRLQSEPNLAKDTPTPDPEILNALNHSTKGAEALAVLVNYLVYHVDAFSAPKLKQEVSHLNSERIKNQIELEELHTSYNRLNEKYVYDKELQELAIEDIHKGYEEEKNELSTKFREEYDKLSNYHRQKIEEIKVDFERKEANLKTHYDTELEKVNVEHLQEVESLRKNLKNEADQLKKDYCDVVTKEKCEQENLKLRIQDLVNECENLKQKSQLFMNSNGKESNLKISMQQCNQLQSEVDSLRVVLDLKSTELLELRRQSQVWQRDAEQLPLALQKAATLQARVEDLKAKLNVKESHEHHLIEEIGNLSIKFEKESKLKKRLSMQNEELQYKIKKNCEVVNVLAALAGPKLTPRMTAYGPNKTPSGSEVSNKETLHPLSSENISPCGSPKVQSVVEKTDSVAWTLDIEEPPEQIANNLVRKAQASCSLEPRNFHRRSQRAMKSLGLSPMKLSRSSPSTPEMRSSPESGWTDEEEHVTEEVIMVNLSSNNLLELFDIEDNIEIQIDDVQKKAPSEEELEMLRRVEDPSYRREVVLPKESGGEAMISGEASDEDDDNNLDSIHETSSDDYCSDKDSNGPF